MNQELLDWLLLLGRWVHITTGVTWIGSSIFFMWLDRSFVKNPNSTNPAHIGDLWMVHGGGFYHVEKMQMGKVKVPDDLHWFKWESYWTWMSGAFLFALIFFTGSGTFLLNPDLKLSFLHAATISLGAIFGSWFVYDFLWESSLTKNNPINGHLITVLWISGMSYFLCQNLSGRAAYMVMGAMIGTWMTANVFMRIIPRQVLMVEAAKRGESPNAEWSKNAKNRSTHNTYLTLPIIFIMLSNHFPSTYGHDLNWLILLLMCAAGAAVREFFVVRLTNPVRAKKFGIIGGLIILAVMIMTRPESTDSVDVHSQHSSGSDAGSGGGHDDGKSQTPTSTHSNEKLQSTGQEGGENSQTSNGVEEFKNNSSLEGVISFAGTPPERRKLTLPQGCAKPGEQSYSNEVLINDRKIQNVLVRIVAGHEKLPVGPTPEKAVELDQTGCLYQPHFIIARTNQEVVFVNSDPVFHNVRATTQDNGSFNLAMPLKNQRISKRFSRPEISLQTQCSVHPWMNAYIAVSEHPYLALSDRNGHYQISNLAPGKYTVEFWHEVFGSVRQEITLEENKASTQLNHEFHN